MENQVNKIMTEYKVILSILKRIIGYNFQSKNHLPIVFIFNKDFD